MVNTGDAKRSSLLILILSIIASYLLSMTNPGIGNMEMGALLNLYLPGVIAVVSLVLFLILIFRFRSFFSLHFRIVSLLLFIINLATGLYLHFVYKG